MNWVDKLSARTWSVLVIGMLAFAISGCEGDTGPEGPQGPQGPEGPEGPQGEPGPVPDDVEAAIANADPESCGTCHGGSGEYHQAVYAAAYGDSLFEITIGEVNSQPDNGGFELTITFSIDYDGMPFDVDPNNPDEWVEELTFRPANWDDASGMFVQVGAPFSEFAGITGPVTSNGGGSYTLTSSVSYDVDAWDSGSIVGVLGEGRFEFPDNPYAPPKRVEVYEELSHDAVEVGMGPLSADYQSLANVAGCTKCHGSPYRKHGNIEASVEGAPDFANCKACHFDDRSGGHEDWQWMVDDPAAWAAYDGPGAVPPELEATYAYTADVMNVTHMSHAMEFPYPQSMSNCATCHEGNVAAVLDDSYFDFAVCKSCHVIDGVDAWPALDDGTAAEIYAQPHRPPPMTYLWANADVDSYHNVDMTCQNCHGMDGFSAFSDMHSGYDKTIYDASGNRYSATNTVAVDSVSVAGDLITVDFSATNVDIVPTLAISFYGWDTKHFIVPAHERDANATDCAHPQRPGCNIEWSPGSTKPFFTEEAGSVAGDWSVTFDMSLFQAVNTDPIPQLIADGVVKYIEVTVLPVLTGINLEAVSTSYDLGTMMMVDGYYQQGVTSPEGKGTTVDFDNCVACHDNLSTIVHSGRGRWGDSMQTCKVCHNTTYDGSHLEMQSRSIDSYVHSIHMFQPLDENDVYNANDAVFTARNDLHKHHTLPVFTALACEACHVAGTYNVPDQSKSMPGAQSSAWDDIVDPNARAIGTVPSYVTGPASRACGSCHRADLIVHDDAGGIATFNAHTDAFGTLEEYNDNDEILFGIIEKIMGMFQ